MGLTVGQVTEVNKDTFWPIVNAAGDKTVVLDMYTQWYASYFNYFFLFIYFSCDFLKFFFYICFENEIWSGTERVNCGNVTGIMEEMLLV